MTRESKHRRAIHSWLFLTALFLLCGVLGFLQYIWIGEAAAAARERLRASLQSALFRLAQDFNSEIAAGLRALATPVAAGSPEQEIAARYDQWKATGPRHAQMFRRIAIATAKGEHAELHVFDPQRGIFEPAAWPDDWERAKERLERRLSPEGWQSREPRPRGPGDDDGLVVEVPLFSFGPPGALRPAERPPMPWLLAEMSLAYVRDTMLPELIARHFGEGSADYHVEVLSRSNPQTVIYHSEPGQPGHIGAAADATAGLFEVRYDQILRLGQRGGRERERGPGREPMWAGQRAFRPGAPALGAFGRPGPGFGRWEIFVRHRAGSLDALVSHARWRNLGVTGGVLLLMAATAGALFHFTRRSQKLAQLQMDFVAGVSHELRTPLTVIHTAAYNLRGKLAANPAQVEKYGTLIQQESGRLKDLVEQILRFAGAESGRVIQEREPVCVQTLIEEALASSKAMIQAAHCEVETAIEPGLPLVLADPVALKLALGNLIANAVKYGTGDSNWIGVFAARTNGGAQDSVQIRVADRGPGIPEDEQEQIFDPFFRGRRAIQDQVHGTGLGLNLVKRIVEAHGGAVRVTSAPMKGAEFVLCLPALPAGAES